MIMPNGEPITVSPRKAPPRDRITAVMIIKGCATELNWVTRIRKIRKRAMAKALERNS
jgi:hypothetical protein